MNNISTTDLRTKTTSLVEILAHGGCVDLVHRSRTIGEIKPKNTTFKVLNGNKLQIILEKLNFPRLTEKEMSNRYKTAMTKKHG